MMPQENDFLFGAPLECKFDGSSVSAAGEFTGLASAYSLDYQGDRIRPGAFSATLVSQKASGLSVPLLFSHRQDKPIGRILKMAENEFGLDVTGKFNLQTTAGREAREHALAGDLSGLSMGYTLPPGGAVTAKDGTRTLQRINLKEISLVAVPAQNEARIRQVKTLASAADIARVLHAGGVPDRLATKIAALGIRAVPGADFEDDEDVLEEFKQELETKNLERFAVILRRQNLQLKGLK